MSDYGISITWGAAKTGREAASLALWADAMGHAEKLKANGRIDDYDAILFGATAGGAPNGVFTLWGSEDQIKELVFDEERAQLVQRTGLLLNDVAEVRSIRGNAILEGLGSFTELVNGL